MTGDVGHFDEIYRRFERLEQEYHAITQALRRIEAGVADGRREILARDLAELKQHVAALQSRIEESSASDASLPGRSSSSRALLGGCTSSTPPRVSEPSVLGPADLGLFGAA